MAWKTLHAFADHCKSASGNSTACRGKPRIHADPPTPGSAAPAPGRPRTEPGHRSKPGSFSRKRTRRQRRPQRRRCGQALSTPAAPLPASVRDPRGPPAARTPPAPSRRKVCLKSNTSQHRRCTAAGPTRPAEPPPACRSGTRKRRPPAASGPGRRHGPRQEHRDPGQPRPRRSSCSPAAAGAGTAGLQPGHRERR